MSFYEEEDDFIVKRRRRNEPDFWHRLNRVLQALVVAGFLLTVGVMFYPVWQQQQDMRLRLLTLEREQSDKTAALQGKQRQLELLRNDREYLETIARDRLNVMKPGETIFRIELPRS
jgi:cell division protein FtsB